jgi:hypothetical protein
MKENDDKMNRLMKKTVKKIKSDLKKAKTDEEKETLNRQLKYLKPRSKKEQKEQKQKYFERFCNPDCSETVYQEDADFKNNVDELCKKYEMHDDPKRCIKTLKKMRKLVHSGRKTILQNSFHYGIPKTIKAKLMKDGAISGCALKNELHFNLIS